MVVCRSDRLLDRTGKLRIKKKDGSIVGLSDDARFAGFAGDAGTPKTLVLKTTAYILKYT